MMNETNIVADANHVALVNRQALNMAVATAVAFVDRKKRYEMTDNFRLSHDAGNLKITATDLDSQIEISIDGDIDSRLETNIPAHLLYDITRKSPASESVTISVVPAIMIAANDDGSNAPAERAATEITAVLGKAKFKTSSQRGTFPVFEIDKPMSKFTISASVLLNAISTVFGAVSYEKTHYYLNGVNLTYFPQTGRMRAVATDRHRAYIQEFDCPSGGKKNGAGYHPARHLQPVD